MRGGSRVYRVPEDVRAWVRANRAANPRSPVRQGIEVLLKPKAPGLAKIALNRANVSNSSMSIPGRAERPLSAPARPALKPIDSACSPSL